MRRCVRRLHTYTSSLRIKVPVVRQRGVRGDQDQKWKSTYRVINRYNRYLLLLLRVTFVSLFYLCLPPHARIPYSPPVPSPASASSPPLRTRCRSSPAAGAGTFPDDEMLGDSGGNSGGVPRSGRNGWTWLETLDLIRIRSEMATTFCDATFKAPLWEEVSRKLAELGYERRSAKRCKEKLEQLRKSYKRAEESRAGRQDGQSYLFSQPLDALYAATARAWQQRRQEQLMLMILGGPQRLHAFSAPRPTSAMPQPQPPPPGPIQPAPISWAAPAAAVELPQQQPPVSLQGLSFPSMPDCESDDGASEGDEMAAAGSGDGLGNRKRKRGGGGSKKKMEAFVEGLMKQVVQSQQEMQQRFLATMEKREAERAARDEAWRRQEVARLKREQEQRAHERAAAATRDASIIAFLQRVGGQAAQVVPPFVIPMPTPMQFQTPPPLQATLQPIPAAPLPPRRATPPPQPQPQPIPAAPLQRQSPLQAPQAQHRETTHEEAHRPRIVLARHHSPWIPPPWSSTCPKFADHT
ncbi:trihelix transcription factor GTL1-like [Hordeum vulgare subsp. vulgare]|uniref:trihelix transcription factor GTL1-like n=1 Tax=Hordeum vulgare subsp. vulgare TaxID=112509 RepID=UPI001D1A5A20|nr:trihelix transcription factor GTL1-like [Hordeum vulgare subsp. vulgare]